MSDCKDTEEKVFALQSVLVARAINQGSDDTRYQELRDELLAEPTLRDRLPAFVRTCHTLGQFWGFIQSKSKTYRARRQYIDHQFEPVLDFLAGQQQEAAGRVESPLRDIMTREPTSPSPREAQTSSDPIDAILADVSSRLEDFASITPQLSDIEADLRKRRSIANRLHLSWSGSWIGFHASLYYTGFIQPPLDQQFNSEWGSINGIPSYWESKSYEDIKAYVDSQYDGISFADAAEEIMGYYERAEALHRRVCDELSFLKGVPLFTAEAELLEKLERLEWGKSVDNLVQERAPTSIFSRDRAAMYQGRKVAPHIQMEAEMDSALSIIHGVEIFIADARSVIRRTKLRREIAQPLLGAHSGTDAMQADQRDANVDRRAVVVVYGRDEEARSAMFAFLRSIDLRPIEWSQAVKATKKGSPYIGEVLDAAFSMAQAVVVFLTPDDEARLREEFVKDHDPVHERDLTPQARPNVLFEAGMAMGRHPDRTVLVELGTLRPFSDVAGMHTIRINNSTEKRQDLASRLQTTGCQVNIDGTDWHKAGNFPNRP